ncbi:glycosyltransferase family 25 protein [Marinobacter bohaiensis]|uniref:glycosyltransferase family 25 protein n=1 Tax=Marinobacter bohaiensis TaxID=2201898 RepID=UPI000DAED1C0|nr:glycosyltransferase family 25 protein [Marinobacter bohaiensis]
MSHSPYPIYLVSLPKDSTRRDALKRRFPEFAARITHVEAVDGRELTAKDFFGHILPACMNGHRLMLPGEVGCSLSHIKALRQFLDSEAPAALILEDDVIGDDEAVARIMSLIPALPESALLICGGQEGMPARKFLFGKPTGREGLFRLADFSNRHVFRTCCYVVTRRSAADILAGHDKALQLADAWGRFFQSSPVSIYFANLLQHPEELDSSHLQQERALFGHNSDAFRKTLWDRLTRRIQRIHRKLGALMCLMAGYRRVLPRRR